MSKVSLEDIQKLRSMTSMGMLDCKKALEQAEGDIEKAIELLRKKVHLLLQNVVIIKQHKVIFMHTFTQVQRLVSW